MFDKIWQVYKKATCKAINKKITIRSLQAQLNKKLIHKIRQMRSLISSPYGSITVEASLAIPVFLCMVVTLLGFGQFTLIEAEVQRAVAQTAYSLASQEAAVGAAKQMLGGYGINLDGKIPDTVASVIEMGDANVVFHTVYHRSAISDCCLLGGANAIIVTTSKPRDDFITVRASYALRAPFLPVLFGTAPRSTAVTQQIFTGYTSHGEEEEVHEDVVYMTTNGKVYHTSLSCSHITKQISGIDLETAKKQHKTACSVCIKDGDHPTSLYVSSGGKKYHSSPECSEISRTYRILNKEDVGDIRMCSKCAKGEAH